MSSFVLSLVAKVSFFSYKKKLKLVILQLNKVYFFSKYIIPRFRWTS